MAQIDNDWQQFCDDEYEEQHTFTKNPKKTIHQPESISTRDTIPKSNELYISTQTIISFLNTEIDLKDVFWQLPVLPYYKPQEGIIKKQIKFNSQTKAELEDINQKKIGYEYVDEYVISHIDNPTGRIVFKDVRKISIGISKKDITSYRCKKKSAFYNCFVIILRLLHADVFKEIHVKVFNTGKLEIPGIQNTLILNKVYTLLVETLRPFIKIPIKLSFIQSKTQTVLINSNFNCGYYLKRDVLNDIFKKKYNDKVRSSYDPCTYPGIQCEIYYNQDNDNSTILNALTIATAKTTVNIIKVSFMVFRTGSVLIVGKCSEKILHNIYTFLCSVFINEYDKIHEAHVTNVLHSTIKNTRHSRVKTITVNY
jgi:hypothetical protein